MSKAMQLELNALTRLDDLLHLEKKCKYSNLLPFNALTCICPILVYCSRFHHVSVTFINL